MLPSWDLTQRQVCDIELLLNSGFWPPGGSTSHAESECVGAETRLADGGLWPSRSTSTSTSSSARGSPPARIALQHPEGMVRAVMTVSDVWSPDRGAEVMSVYGTALRSLD